MAQKFKLRARSFFPPLETSSIQIMIAFFSAMEGETSSTKSKRKMNTTWTLSGTIDIRFPNRKVEN